MSFLNTLRRSLQLGSAAIVFITLWMLWPQEMDNSVSGRGGLFAVPDYAMTNARYVSVQKGKVELESVAQETFYDLAARRMDARQVVADFFNEDGRPTNVTADRASFFMDERRVRLEGNVVSLSPDGFRMRGEEAQYFTERRFLTADQPVAGETEDGALKVWGNRAESLLDERKAHFIGDARAEIKEKKRGLTTVRGDTATLDREKAEVLFNKNVRVNQDKVVATSESARLLYSPEERYLRYMSLLDNVKIREGVRHTRSQVAEFFAPNDTIVLTGLPAVYHRDDAVTGDRITLYRATGVVEVTQTNAAASSVEPARKEAPVPLTKEDEELIP